MAQEETCFQRTGPPYSDRPFHDMLRSSAKRPLFRQQYSPRSAEAGFFPTCFELSRYVLSTSLRFVPPCWASLPYTPRVPPERSTPRLDRIVASLLRDLKRESHRTMPRTAEHRTVPHEIAYLVRRKSEFRRFTF